MHDWWNKMQTLSGFEVIRPVFASLKRNLPSVIQIFH